MSVSMVTVYIMCDGNGCNKEFKNEFLDDEFESVYDLEDVLELPDGWAEDNGEHFCPECAEIRGL